MKALFLLSLIPAIALAIAPIAAEPTDNEIQNSLVTSSNELGVKMLQYFLNNNPQANTSLSPFPIASLCLMLAGGTEGDTREELEKAILGSSYNELLNGENAASTRPQLLPQLGKIQSSLFNKKNSSLSKTYLYADSSLKMEQSFLDKISPLKVNATTMQISRQPTIMLKHINTQVAKDPNNQIKYFLTSPLQVHSETQLILLNILGFNGKWKVPFYDSIRSEFYLKKEAPPIWCKYFIKRDYKEYIEAPDFHLIYKEYKDSSFLFVAILPKKLELHPFLSTHKSLFAKDDASSCYSLITQHRSESLSAQEDEPETIVRLLLPEFNILTPTLNLTSFLQSQGVKEAFSGKAQFKGISQSSPIYLEYILQKNLFRIDKLGTVAYSASDASAPFGGPPKPPVIKKVHFNRPFLYGLMDSKSGAFIFLGAVNDPTKN